jgi:hypothetical protein
LLAVLEHQNILVPGKNPGTTLGALIRMQSAFEIVDKKKGLWRLKSKVYNQETAAVQKHASILHKPASENPLTH